MREIDIRSLVWGINARNASASVTSPSSMLPSELIPFVPSVGFLELREDGGVELREDGGRELEE